MLLKSALVDRGAECWQARRVVQVDHGLVQQQDRYVSDDAGILLVGSSRPILCS